MSYYPREGTLARRVVTLLVDTGRAMRAVEIMSLLGEARDASGFHHSVRQSVDAGIVLRSQDAQGIATYSARPRSTQRTFSIGWPRGYEVPGRSPFDPIDAAARNTSAEAAHTRAMRAGGLEEINRGRGYIPGIGRDQQAADKRDAIRRGAL